MKELYLTVTDMTFLAGGKVLGHGRTVAAAPGPERPGATPAALSGGVLRMGVFRPAQGETPAGRWTARLEGQEGYAVTFRGDRFLLGYRPEKKRAAKAVQGVTAAARRSPQQHPVVGKLPAAGFLKHGKEVLDL